MKVCSVEEMRQMDRRASEEFLIPERLLMENAALGSCVVIRDAIGIAGRRFFIVCGIGNNGGDGLVLARQLHSMGASVLICIAGNREKYKGISLENLNSLLKIPVPVFDYSPSDEFKNALKDCDVVVDALFGTGLTRDVEGMYREIIVWINQSGTIVVSLDIPSGINGDTGAVMGEAIRADYTITFGLPKLGSLLFPGYGHCGKLYVTPISFPLSLQSKELSPEAGESGIHINLPRPLEKRNPAGHKGSFGDVLFIAGAASYLGAPYFSALSFLKAGGGYSRLASPGSIIPAIASGGREIVFVPQKETAGKSIAYENAASLLELSSKADMVVMGSGLSLDPDTRKLVCHLAEKIEKPLLIDGDGLTAISDHIDIIVKRKSLSVLTPHPGEMSALTGESIKTITGNPIGVLKETVLKLRTIVVLKQAHTLTGLPDGKIYINVSGNSGMATAGSGDVLTGCIAAMYGLKLPLAEAVKAGVFIHGLAGDKAQASKGQDGMTASDILECLPAAVKSYREDYHFLMKNCYNKIISVW
jgi:hydroxyethylthiazole kinase-like uncharacterized protein yjeF